MINLNDINYTFVASLIPDVMNALYNEDASKDISLHEIRDAFRIKQIQSKARLMAQIQQQNIDKDSKILVIGSWLGFTSWCLYKLGFKNITEIDLDIRLENFARHLNRFNQSFQHITNDVNNISVEDYDVVINTSCEHILNNSWFDSIDNNTILFLQSNNLHNVEDHVNTCNSLDEMIKKYPLRILCKEDLDFDQWHRYMIVGYKK